MFDRIKRLVCVAGVVAVVGGAALAQPSSGRRGGDDGGENRVVKLVDARDLSAVLPRTGGRMPIVDLFTGVRNVLGMHCEIVGDGLFLMSGSEESQAQAVAILDEVRALYQGQYEVSVVCYPAAAGGPPEIGTAVKLNDVQNPPVRLRQVVTRRVETPVESTKTVQYIAKWQPVVSDQSVGYDAQPEKAKSGLEITLLAGSGPDGADGVDLRIRGQISEVELRDVNVPLPGMKGESMLPMQLPTVMLRSLSADGVVGSEGRVMAVVPGFRPGEVMVVAAAVRVVGAGKAGVVGKPAGGK